MRHLFNPRRIVALGLFASALSGLVGCGGGGSHGSGGGVDSNVAAELQQGNFSGSFDSPSRAASTTACTIQFGNSGSSVVGVASFVSGTPGQTDFRTYSADIGPVTFTYTDPKAPSKGGTEEFDMSNFTAGAPFDGTLHYKGAFKLTTVSNALTLNSNGTLTGKNKSGQTISLSFGISTNGTLTQVNLKGAYTGTIGLAITGADGSTSVQDVPWTGTLSDAGVLKLAAAIKTNIGLVSFTGQNARTSFAGSFDGASLNPLAAGMVGEWYMETHDNGQTLVGGYVVIDGSTGAPFTVGGVTLTGRIAATRQTTTSTFKTGNYDGGLKPNGAADGRVMRLNVVNANSATGANGGMVIITNSAAPNIGGRIASVAVAGSTATITVDNLSNTYSKIVVTGDIQSGSDALKNAAYAATLTDGTTERGTFDALGRVSVSTSNLTGSWSGTAKSTVNGKTNTFAATFKSNGDGTVLITPTSTIGGGTYPTITIPAFTAYQAENSFAGHVNNTVTVTSLGTPLVVRVTGDFDGDANSTAIAGSYAYAAGLDGSAPILTDSGSLSLTKG